MVFPRRSTSKLALYPPSILVPSVSRATLALSCRFHTIIVVVVIFFFFRPSWIS